MVRIFHVFLFTGLFYGTVLRAGDFAVLRSACRAGLAWGCLELAQLDDALVYPFPRRDGDACRMGRNPTDPSGLPPIVVPPVIAAFNPFAIEITRPRAIVEYENLVLKLGGFSVFAFAKVEAMLAYRTACLHGLPGACHRAGVLLRYAGYADDSKIIFRISCETDESLDCLQPVFEDQDDAETIRLLYVGCARGNISVCAQLGFRTGNRYERAPAQGSTR